MSEPTESIDPSPAAAQSDRGRPDLSVVIPVWNGEHNLGKLLPRVFRTLHTTVPGHAEVLVVLPPGDPVGALVERTGARVVAFDQPGYGSALNAGLAASGGRWVATMDADYSHHPEFLRTLWLHRRSADLLIASRYIAGAYYPQPKRWTSGRAAELGIGYLRTIGRLFSLRNSVRAADYDHRAFDSWIPLQRYWQRARFRVIVGMVDGSSRILDIGCGSSRILQSLPQAIGLDMQIRKLRWLRTPGRQLVQASMNELPFPDDAFDAVICSEVIEHIPRGEIDLTEMVRVLAPGGILVLGTPDYGRFTWRALEGAYKKVFPQGYATEHINPYTRQELRGLIERMGLTVLDLRYVGASEMIFKAVKRTPRSDGRASLRATGS